MTAALAARRLHPPDRRCPTQVAARGCPQGRQCGCCTGDHRAKDDKGHHVPCRLPHPATDRTCLLPYPADPPACPEREHLPQLNTGAPHGRCCIECGRVTARLYIGDALPWAAGQRLPWCAGRLPDEIQENH